MNICGPNSRVHTISFLHFELDFFVGKFFAIAASKFEKSLENTELFRVSRGYAIEFD